MLMSIKRNGMCLDIQCGINHVVNLMGHSKCGINQEVLSGTTIPLVHVVVSDA